MNDIQIGQPSQLHWFWVIGVCAIVGAYAMVRRRRAIGRFATPIPLANSLVEIQTIRQFVRGLLTVSVVSLVAFALVDLRWGKVWRDVPQKGIEVMFVLDVSRSMLGDDATPTRLERAKQQISDTIEEMQGDRVGLILFAGEVRQKLPLTNHYEDFRQRLREVGPQEIPRGGSRLGDAIRVASQSFLDKTRDHKAVVIFTDGEDMESDPIGAARAAYRDHGIRIFCVGLGDDAKGARIPNRVRRGYVTHQGETVWSKLDGEILQQIADASSGAYIPAGTKQVDMSKVYHGYIASVEQSEFTRARINSYEARFQWFLAPAILLLMLEIWIRTGIRTGIRRSSYDRPHHEGMQQESRKPVSDTPRRSSNPDIESAKSSGPTDRQEVLA